MNIVDDAQVDPQQDRQFHQALDESAYVGYFEPFRKRQYRHVLDRASVSSGARLIDIGASYGWMVDVGLEMGLDAFGVEPSPMAYSDRLRPRIACRTLEEESADAGGDYDVVTLWHVLEHLRDPFASLRDVAKLLAADGVAVIAVPNARGRMYRLASLLIRRARSARVMEELWYTHNPNMHRYYPTEAAVGCLLNSAGLDVVDAYTMEAFDWRKIWERSTNAVGRTALRAFGPVIERSRLTSNENLIVVARKSTTPATD